MSEFSDAFANAYDAAIAVFGDTCTLAGRSYPCIIHGLTLTEGIRPGLNAGRAQIVGGTVIISTVHWLEAVATEIAAGRKGKGLAITLPGGVFRATNNPDVGYESDTVELTIGPLA